MASNDVTLTQEQVDMLVEALMKKNQEPRGRRKFLVDMLLDAAGKEYTDPVSDCEPASAPTGVPTLGDIATRGIEWAANTGNDDQDLLASGIGIVGCGEIALSYAKSVGALPNGRVVAVFDINTNAATQLAKNVGAVACATLEALLAREDVRVVLNLTPVEHHFSINHAILSAGKHVWSEKPLASTSSEARELMSLAKERSLALGCSPVTYWGEAQQTVARHLQKGLIGTVRFAQVDLHCGAGGPADWNNHDPSAFQLGGWATHPRMKDGSMVDVGVYALSLLTAFLGPVREVVEHTPEPVDTSTPPLDIHAAQLVFESGAMAQLSSCFSLTTTRKRSLTLYGDLGSLCVENVWDFDSNVLFSDATGGTRTLICPLRPPTSRHADHPHAADWARGIQLMDTCGPNVFTGDHAAHLVDVLSSLRESSHTRTIVRVQSDFAPLPLLPASVIPTSRLPGCSTAASRIVFGTMNLGGIKNNMELLDAAWALGINVFDTALVYGKSGTAETALGRWLETRHIDRSDVVLIGKGGHPTLKEKGRLDRASLSTDLQKSLSRLAVSHFDLYLLHRDDPTRSVDEIVVTMNDFCNAGLIHEWGTSNWSTPRIQQAIKYAAVNALKGPCVVSPQYSLPCPSRPVWPDATHASPSALKMFNEVNLPVLGWSPLANGFMSGRWDKSSTDSIKNPHFGEGHQILTWCSPNNLRLRAAASAMAATKNISLTQLTIGFILKSSPLVFPIIGTSTLEHLYEVVSACEVSFSDEELQFLTELREQDIHE